MRIKHKHLEFFAVFLLLLTGLILRLAYISHGLPNYEVPDEVDFVGPALNLTFALPEVLRTHNLALLNTDYHYGHPHGFSNILFIFFTMIKEFWQGVGSGVATWSRSDFFIIARVITAIFSSFTGIYVWLITRRYFGKRSALVALVLTSFFYYFISSAHAASPYPVNGFFVLAFFYYLLGYYSQPNFKKLIICGLFFGLAEATNFGSFLLLVPILLAGILFWQEKKLPVFTILQSLLVLGLTALIAFFVFSPFTIINWRTSLKNFKSMSLVQQGGCLYSSGGFDPNHYLFQPADSASGLSVLDSSSVAEAGGLIFTALVILTVVFSLIQRKKYLLIIFSGFVGALAFYSFPNNKALRWLLPFLPLTVIGVSYYIARIGAFVRSNLIIFIMLGVILTSSFYKTYYFLKAYSVADTRDQALDWIFRNIPKDVPILRPTNYSPPIWRFGYGNDRQMSHPGCAASWQDLEKIVPGPLVSYVCSPQTPNLPTKYIIVVDSVINPILSSANEQNHPALHDAWKKFYDEMATFQIAAKFTTTLENPRTGPNVIIYKAPDFDCGSYNAWYWKNFKV